MKMINTWLIRSKSRFKLWWNESGSRETQLYLLWISDPGTMFLGTCWAMPYSLWELSVRIEQSIEDDSDDTTKNLG